MRLLADAFAHDRRARRLLEAAMQRGASGGYWKDEARLLAAELGEAVAPEQPFDPPFPPLTLAGARLALAPAKPPGDGSAPR